MTDCAGSGAAGGPALHIHNYPSDGRMEQALRLLRQLDRKVDEAMATLREELTEALGKLVEEVRETRTATDAVGVTVQGLRDQLQNAVQTGDIESVRTVIAGLDEVQAQLAAAGGENVDPTPEPTPGPTPEPTPGA